MLATQAQVVDTLAFVVSIVFAIVAYSRALAFRNATGRNPWGIHPVIWLIVSILTLFGSILCLVACVTTKPRPSPRQFAAQASGPMPVSYSTLGIGAAAPGWYADPSGQHHQRYWDGTSWTPYIADGGLAGVDGPMAPTSSGPAGS